MITNKPINVSDERLAEMAKIKKDNQKINDAIIANTEILRQEKAKFETYKSEQTQLILSEKANIKKQADALEASRVAFEDRVKAWEQEHMHEVK
jgi:hypothetical protein